MDAPLSVGPSPSSGLRPVAGASAYVHTAEIEARRQTRTARFGRGGRRACVRPDADTHVGARRESR